MNIIRTEEEVQNRIDCYCYKIWVEAQSGSNSSMITGSLSLLFWMIGKEWNDNEIYKRGEKIYRDGFKFQWDNRIKDWKKVRRFS